MRMGRDRWKKLVKRYRESGMTQTEFAAKNELSVWTLRSWLRRLPEDPTRRRIPGDPSKADSLDTVLVMAAHKHGALQTGQVAAALDVSRAVARRYLTWLCEEGRLRRVGYKRGTRYLAVKK